MNICKVLWTSTLKKIHHFRCLFRTLYIDVNSDYVGFQQPSWMKIDESNGEIVNLVHTEIIAV